MPRPSLSYPPFPSACMYSIYLTLSSPPSPFLPTPTPHLSTPNASSPHLSSPYLSQFSYIITITYSRALPMVMEY